MALTCYEKGPPTENEVFGDSLTPKEKAKRVMIF
jgi:hypothetical protein